MLFATENDFSEITKKQIITRKNGEVKTLRITWHKPQRLAEGSHAKVLEAFSLGDEAAGNCFTVGRRQKSEFV